MGTGSEPHRFRPRNTARRKVPVPLFQRTALDGTALVPRERCLRRASREFPSEDVRPLLANVAHQINAAALENETRRTGGHFAAAACSRYRQMTSSGGSTCARMAAAVGGA